MQKNTYSKDKNPEPDPVMERQVEPIGDRVICRRLTRAEEVRDGIIIPDAAAEAPQEAMVVAVGPGSKTPEGERIPVQVERGTRVILPRFGGVEIEIGRIKYQLLHEDEIIAIVRKPEEEKKKEEV